MKKLTHCVAGLLVVATFLLCATMGVSNAGDSAKAGSTLTLPTAAPGKIYYTGVNNDGDIIPQPACPGGQAPKIFAAPVRAQAGAGSDSKDMSAFTANATDLGNGTWRVEVKVLNTEGTITGGTSRMLVITRCCATSGC